MITALGFTLMFAIVILMGLLQRVILGDSDFTRMSRREQRADREAAAAREAARGQAVTATIRKEGSV